MASSGPIGPAADIATERALRSAAPDEPVATTHVRMRPRPDRSARSPEQPAAFERNDASRGLVGPSPLLYGRAVTFKVPAAINASTPIVSAAQPPPSEHARVWTIVVQAEALPMFHASTLIAGSLNITIRYMLGSARFQKTITIVSLAVTRVPVHANNVQVEVQWVPPGGEGSPALLSPQVFTVNVAVEPGYLEGLEQYAPTWYPSQLPEVAQFYLPGPGYWLAASGGVTAMPLAGGPVYILAIDAAIAEPLGASLILSTSPPLVLGQAFSFDDELGPALQFSRGLWLAMSSTPAAYAAPVGGGSFYADVKVGT